MNFYFAPLEGVTGFTYRNAFADLFGGPDKYYAPFVSPTVNDRFKGKEIRDLLPENNRQTIKLIPQILTNKGEYFIKAANQLMELGYTSELNINIGCPSGTVVAKNKGAGFLRDPDGMDRFFDEIFNWRDKSMEKGPNISVKTRIGIYKKDEFPDILEIYNKYPIRELIVHPRTREQMYRGIPNMETFDYAVEKSRNPLCYNGDINTVRDYKQIAGGYDINAVMIGRGLLANPNLVNEIKGAEHITKEQLRSYHDRLYSDFEVIMKADKHLLFKMKEFWNYVSWNFVDEHKCAKLIRKCQNLYKYNLAVEEIFANMEVKDKDW
ncbi:MAG: tRNA dihydrouridine synthase [Eubacterium sp.]